MSALDALQQEVQGSLERHLGALVSEREEEAWTLPAVADWLLVFGVEDLDGSGAVTACVNSRGPLYRRIGLVAHYLRAANEEAS